MRILKTGIFPLISLFAFFFTGPEYILAQSPNVPLNQDYYHLLDRFEIKSGRFSPSFHSSMKPYRREDVGSFLDQLDPDSLSLSKADLFNFNYLADDNFSYTTRSQGNSKKPFLKYYFRKKRDLYYVRTPDFELHLNPVLHFSAGKEKDNEVVPLINSRGLEASGMIAGRIGYYTYITTTQAIYPSYVRTWIDRNRVVPGEGFWKVYSKNGVDYYTARGYISFNVARPVNIQFGHDKVFLGNGIRSMGLSDFSNSYLFLKINLNVWKLNYQVLFAQLYADTEAQPGTGSLYGNYPRKYLAHHHLSFNVTRNLNIGFFENIIQGDSTSSAFDINYLNPAIFYRALEHQSGSKDNAMVGLDFKWNLLRRFSLYGQFLLDEFLLKEVKSGNGWWANKYGAQAGLKYIDVFGLNNLDLNIEYNTARPYTYAHASVFTNYAHYRMPMAHPTGANFREFIAQARWQPAGRLSFTAELIFSDYGEDDMNSNWGKDVMKSYITREQDYGNEIGQGLATTLRYMNFTASWQFKHNVFLDFEFMLHDVNSELQLIDYQSLFSGIHFRWNFPRKVFDF